MQKERVSECDHDGNNGLDLDEEFNEVSMKFIVLVMKLLCKLGILPKYTVKNVQKPTLRSQE